VSSTELKEKTRRTDAKPQAKTSGVHYGRETGLPAVADAIGVQATTLRHASEDLIGRAG
jgi:hydroxyethylthiazole kinase-like sugar kinase family protein